MVSGGPRTEAWTKRFQEDSGIGIDGIVGPKTHAAMLESLNKGGRVSALAAKKPTVTPTPSTDPRYFGSRSGIDFSRTSTDSSIQCTGNSCAFIGKTVLDKLQIARGYMLDKYGGKYDIGVTSAFRTPESQASIWNKNPNRAEVCGPTSGGSFSHCPHVGYKAGDFSVIITEGNQRLVQNHVKDDAQAYSAFQDALIYAGFINYKAEPWHWEIGTSRYFSCIQLGKTSC